MLAVVKQGKENGEEEMAVGFIVTPMYNSLCKLELPCFHTSSLSSLVSHRPALRHLPLRYHSPPYPGLPRVSVPASSLWKQQGLVNEDSKEADTGSTYELSSVFMDILKQRNESGLSNDVVDIEGNGSGSDAFVVRRRGGHVEKGRNHETSSPSTDTEVSLFGFDEFCMLQNFWGL